MKNLTATEMQRLLRQLGACAEARTWANGKTLSEIITTCERGDWLLWLCGNMMDKDGWLTRKQLVSAACDCAELSVSFATDPRVASCLATTRAWVAGNVTINQVRTAVTAAAYAAYAADAAGAAGAAGAATAAAYAAGAANAANAAGAAGAANAAAYAADAAGAAAAATAAAYAAGAAGAANAAAYAADAATAAAAANAAAYAADAATAAAYAADAAGAAGAATLQQCADIVRTYLAAKIESKETGRPQEHADDVCEACGKRVATRECSHGILCSICDAQVHGKVNGICLVGGGGK